MAKLLVKDEILSCETLSTSFKKFFCIILWLSCSCLLLELCLWSSDISVVLYCFAQSYGVWVWDLDSVSVPNSSRYLVCCSFVCLWSRLLCYLGHIKNLVDDDDDDDDDDDTQNVHARFSLNMMQIFKSTKRNA